MINFNAYRLLNESLGYSLGVRPVQSIGLSSNRPLVGEAGFGGDPMNNDPMNGPPNDNPDNKSIPEDMPPPEEGHDEEEEHGDLMAKIEKLEKELADLKAQIGEDKDADMDHEDDLGGEDEGDKGSEMGGEMSPGLPLKKPVTAFMKKEAKEEPTFMMKKAKKCGDGDADDMNCKKCGPMKKESTGYERPKNWDNSEKAWLDSVSKQIAVVDVRQRYSDGTDHFKTEDFLIPPPPGGGLEAIEPGGVGYAPQNRVGDFSNEAVRKIMDRLDQLER